MANNWFLRLDEDANTWASLVVNDASVEADSTAISYNIYDFQAVYADSVQIYYDVESTVGQITGGAEFPFASVISDTSGTYTISNASVEKDLVSIYSMRQPIDTQLYATYRVLIGVEQDATLAYALGGAVDPADLDFYYWVFTGVEQDVTPTYQVAGEVLADQTVTYNMTSTPLTASNTVTPTWNVISAVQQDKVLTYRVLMGVEKDLSATFSSLSEVLKDYASTFDVNGAVTSDLVPLYNILSYEAVTKDYQFAFNVNSDIVVVPNVIGLPLSKATSTLTAAGLTVGTVTYTSL